MLWGASWSVWCKRHTHLTLAFARLPPCAARILFYSWVPTGGAYVASCLAVMALAAALQALRALRAHCEARWAAQAAAGPCSSSSSATSSCAGMCRERAEMDTFAFLLSAALRLLSRALITCRTFDVLPSPLPQPPAAAAARVRATTAAAAR